MSNPREILKRAHALGLKLTVEGDRIAIRPARMVPQELAVDIRAHKPELLGLLEADQYDLSPDCAPWVHVARQVLAGEFDDGERSLIESVLIGVRSIRVPCCQQARARLERHLGKQKESRR